MKKIFPVILAFLLVFISFPTVSYAAETHAPSRCINLVYDDSGSMVRTDSIYVDTWCQAKYAMEVFAAMLGENDTLNIYYMSDYTEDTSAPPKISLRGSHDSAVTESNVAQIHNLVTDASYTPFRSVEKAYMDLMSAQTDEKWLVVLTDGEFNNTTNTKVENYLKKCVSDGKTKTVMFAMGPNAASITPDERNNVFFYKAENSVDIPAKLTSVCSRIFQNNALEFDTASRTVSFNIPMSELIVFAQGENVSIGSISSSDGEKTSPSSNVKVKYSTDATTDKKYSKSKIQVATNLRGCVATYAASFAPGTYNLDISGADTVEVYYKPDVAIAAYLYDNDNNEVTQQKNITAGKYRLEFGFINGTTGEKITDTSLLGNIRYDAVIENICADGNDSVTPIEYGDMVSISQGQLNIDVTANFLDYNTVNAKLSFTVYGNNDLIFAITQKPVYKLDKSGFSNADEPMLLTVKISGSGGPRDLTPEELELLGIPKVESSSSIGEFRVEKASAPGTYNIYPTLKNNDPYQTKGGITNISVSGEFVKGDSTAEGILVDEFEIEDEISAAERIKNWLEKNGLKLAISLAALVLVCGYIPPFKKYLPRKLKRAPFIECRAEKVGVKDRESHGKYKRSLISTLIPYKAETGVVTFSPSPYKKTAKLRAAGGNGMYITNANVFAGKQEITFNGMSIEENRKKPYRISGNSSISLRSPEYTYTCYLNR